MEFSAYHPIEDWSRMDYVGVSKREQFAAMAMQGMLSKGWEHLGEVHMAQKAIKLADALIEELNKTK